MILDLHTYPTFDKSWREYFPHILVPNLEKRIDRKERMQNLLSEYEIDFEFYPAIEHEKGFYGLILTMKKMFAECLDKGIERVLVLEDDCSMLVQPQGFHEIMNLVVRDLKIIKWDMLFLGCQHPNFFTHWVTPNILPILSHAYSTHAVAYSKEAMEFVISSHIDEPIDNFFVSNFQKYNTSFCTYPMLCSQEPMYSDIGQSWCDWSQYLLPVFTKNVAPILHERFKTIVKYE